VWVQEEGLLVVAAGHQVVQSPGLELQRGALVQEERIIIAEREDTDIRLLQLRQYRPGQDGLVHEDGIQPVLRVEPIERPVRVQPCEVLAPGLEQPCLRPHDQQPRVDLGADRYPVDRGRQREDPPRGCLAAGKDQLPKIVQRLGVDRTDIFQLHRAAAQHTALGQPELSRFLQDQRVRIEPGQQVCPPLQMRLGRRGGIYFDGVGEFEGGWRRLEWQDSGVQRSQVPLRSLRQRRLLRYQHPDRGLRVTSAEFSQAARQQDRLHLRAAVGGHKGKAKHIHRKYILPV